ncbi:MAG: hypothetical protein H6832_11955 [Planctomycetes bacterium]|nr:hypothetical protein [Planctomycetota bacterium]MCB9919107.1 hypothetical protein [Planctomycetota bacterium]
MKHRIASTIAPLGVALLALAPLALALTVFVASSASATAQRRGEGQQVLDDRELMLDSDTWIYGDLERGLREARKSGKPILLVFR